MKKLHPAAAAAALAFTLGIVLARSGYRSHGPVDTAIFIAFLVFFWWLISDFSGGKAGKSVENSIAFRFGRLLSRVLRRDSRDL